MDFQDLNLTCKDCGQPFVFTAGEQKFYQEKGFANQPTRCPNCRQAKKATFNGGGGGRSAGPRQMFDVTCAKCQKATQVPFQPRGDKPVYCSDCFKEMRGTTAA